jgi:hypothetical protein
MYASRPPIAADSPVGNRALVKYDWSSSGF